MPKVPEPKQREGQVTVEQPTNGHLEEGILQIQSATPRGLHYAQSDWLDRLHLEVWDNQVFVQPREVEDRAECSFLLGDQEDSGEVEGLL